MQASRMALALGITASMALAAAPSPGAGSDGSGAFTPRAAPTFRFFKPISDDNLALNYATYPKTLSATGFFTDMASRTVGPGIYAFDVNSPLWSDGAGKSRYLVLPENTVVTYVNDSDEYVFPEGATFVKHFHFDSLVNGSAQRNYIETRILVYKAPAWHGFSYKWRKDQSDADLVGGLEGSSELDTFSVAGDGGKPRKKKWLYPARLGHSGRGFGFATCNSCHLNRLKGRKRGILGFITPQLTGLVDGKDQIQDMMERGYLVLGKGASYHPATAHRWYALEDSARPGATLEKRARSYLAANCSHCHSAPEGNASCFPIFSYNAPGSRVNYIDKAGRGAWGLKVPIPDSAKWIDPGKPEYSTLLRRISAADSEGYRDTLNYGWLGQSQPTPRAFAAKMSGAGPAGGALAKTAGWEGNGRIQMPPLSTYEVNPLANRLIHDWIKGMPAGYTVGAAHFPFPVGAGIRLAKGLIHLPESMQALLKAELTDLRGKSIPLTALRPGVFGFPAGLENGVYCLTAGSRRFSLAYFPPR